MKKPLLLSLAILLLLGAACQKKSPNTTTTTKTGVTITLGTPAAFGSLSSISLSPSTAQRESVTGTSSDSTGINKDLMIRPGGTTTVVYSYSGDTLSLTEAKINVFERTVGQALAIPSSLQNTAGLGRMDISRLTNPLIENLTIANGDELWSINPADGTISMYRRTSVSTAVQIEADQPTGSAQPTNASATPPTIDINGSIAIANTYLTRIGFSTKSYGQPLVTSSSGYGAPVKALDSTTSMPVTGTTQIQVTYPLVINDLPVVQSSGEAVGLTVTIDQSTSEVLSVIGMTTLTFTQSAYDAMTDASMVITAAEKGGYSGPFGTLITEGTVTSYKLGTPERVLMLSYLFSNDRSRELYVPALRFPILEQTSSYPTAIVVPLAKDLPSIYPTGIYVPATTSGGAGASDIRQ